MLLTEKRPLKTPVVFGGHSFFIDMSFNNILSVFEIMEDAELDDIEKGRMMLYMLTGEEDFIDDAFMTTQDDIDFTQDFLGHVFETLIIEEETKQAVPRDVLGNPLPIKKDDDDEDDDERTFDFVHDAKYIYASFMQAYHIDLYEKHNKMHWEQFLALFNGLPSETIMMKVIDVRERPLPKGKGTEEQARELKRAKQKFALPEKEEI